MLAWSEIGRDRLRQYRPFTNGIASHDTFGRVFPGLTQTVRSVFATLDAPIA
ncbi:MAG: hypothetical protein V4754_14030 [Pseudomonadota bacterium]